MIDSNSIRGSHVSEKDQAYLPFQRKACIASGILEQRGSTE